MNPAQVVADKIRAFMAEYPLNWALVFWTPGNQNREDEVSYVIRKGAGHQSVAALLTAVRKMPFEGVDPTRASILNAMKGDLLIALVERAGGRLEMPVAELDRVGGIMLGIEAKGLDTLIFTTERKQ